MDLWCACKQCGILVGQQKWQFDALVKMMSSWLYGTDSKVVLLKS